MTLLRCEHLALALGGEPLLDDATLTLKQGERVCLIGRNGAGKTSFLRIVAGELSPDEGVVWRAEHARVAFLSQELPAPGDETVFDAVAGGLASGGALLSRYRDLAAALSNDRDVELLAQLHGRIEAEVGWALSHRIEAVLTRLALPADRPLSELSGGWLRRVALARALVGEPDLLLLDEPTNHLDIPMIQWLERELLAFRGALLFVTHDRAMIQGLATAIVDLDRGRMRRWEEDYATYLQRRDALRGVEARQIAEEDKRLEREEAWIRQGIKARRTRNEGRVRALEQMREQVRQRRRLKQANMEIDAGERSGKLVKELEGVSFGYGDKLLIRDLDLTIQRRDRIGLIGANGSGKSTLMKLITGDLAPDAGSIRSGTRVSTAYFDQHRAQLDPEESVAFNLTAGREHVVINGRRVHVMQYLGNFLFTAERARTPVKVLSGGERNRLLLARIFSMPANLLLLDEPTNDLDVETLELLEELLIDYEGTLVLATHDRTFLDNVVTSTLVFEGDGVVREFVGGYRDWMGQGGGFADPELPQQSSTHGETSAGRARSGRKQARRERAEEQRRQRALDRIAERIERLESELSDLHRAMSESGFYTGDRIERERIVERVRQTEREIGALYLKWEEQERQEESGGR